MVLSGTAATIPVMDWRQRARDWRWVLRQRWRRRRDLRETEAMHRETDGHDNAEVALPDAERIEWQSFWLVELYLPSHAEALKAGLKLLQRGESSLFHSQEPTEWLSRARSWSGGYWRVGYFSNRRDSSLAQGYRVDLPKTFKGMSAELKQVAPGVTAMIMNFDLAKEKVSCLQQVMEESFETKAVPIPGRPGGQNIFGPEHRKEDHMAEVRGEVRGAAKDWLSDWVPGLFNQLEIEVPAWDLITSEKAGLFEERTEGSERWREALGLGNLFRQWESVDLPGLLIGVPHNDRSGAVPTVTARKEAAEDLATESSYQDGMPGFLSLTDSAVSDLWTIWAFRDAIEAYGQRFTDVRDQLGAPTKHFGSNRRLKRLRNEVMPLSFDLQTCGEAAANQQALAQAHRRSGVEFFPLDFKVGEKKPVKRPKKAFRVGLQEQIEERGPSIAEQGKAITEGLRVQGELLLAATNVRLQWILTLLTIAIGLASVVATLAAN